jgi:transglutaminase-like putative cysteine protease
MGCPLSQKMLMASRQERLTKYPNMAMPAALHWLMAALSLAMLPHLLRLPWWLGILFAAAVGWCWLSATGSIPLPRRWLLMGLTLISITAISLHYNTLFGRDAGVALLGTMAALKLLELRTRRDAMVLVLLGYFLSMANLLYTQTLSTAVYLLIVVALLLTTQINLQRHRVALPPMASLHLVTYLIIQAIPVMLVLFVLFPRIPGPLWGLPKDAHRGLTGLSDEMRPGSISQLSLSDAVAFRVRFSGPIPPADQLYWRGPVLEAYDGYSWRRFTESSYTEFPYQVAGQPVDYTVILEPHGKRWLFALDLPAKLPPDTGITQSLQLLRKQPVNEVLRYEMRSYLRYRTTGTTKEFRQQNLPSHTNPRARALAAEWRKRHANPEAIVQAALTLFHQQPFHYTLRPPLLRHKNATDQFLFETRQGFCEHYASSFVFLMRAAGIPARIITGYLGGERNPLGDYFIVRQSDAHAWAEVWLKQRGWVRVDPTAAVAPERVEHGLYAAVENTDVLPLLARRDYLWIRQLALGWDSLNNAWNEWVLAYGPERQRKFITASGLAWMGSSALAVAMVITLLSMILIYAAFYKLRHRITIDPVALVYQRFCNKLARRGLVREPYEGPLDFTRRAANYCPDVAIEIQRIGQLYATLRYGCSMEEKEAIQSLKRLVDHLKI